MRSLVFLLLASVLTSCASEPKSTPTSLSDGTTAHMLRCDDGWVGCYQTAQRLCGKAGFTELDRMADGVMSSAGRLERMHSVEGGIEQHVYSENPRDEVFTRVLTIRCNTPARAP